MGLDQSKLPVCVLEDDAVSREELVAVTREAGLPASATAFPRQAIAQISTGQCRVVLVSCLLREMDCFAFLDAALQIDPGTNVIIVNGHSTPDSAAEAMKRGARDYLKKPLDRAHLHRTLREITAQLRTGAAPTATAASGWEPLPLDEVRRRHILRVLKYCRGNRVRAARILGIGRTSLYRFLKREARQKAAPTAA